MASYCPYTVIVLASGEMEDVLLMEEGYDVVHHYARYEAHRFLPPRIAHYNSVKQGYFGGYGGQSHCFHHYNLDKSDSYGTLFAKERGGNAPRRLRKQGQLGFAYKEEETITPKKD